MALERLFGVSAMKKRILVVYTGGTIGMTISAKGYVPDRGFEHTMREAQQAWPDIGAACEWAWLAIEPPIDSADMSQSLWLQMRATIVEALAQQHYDGVLVLHGTDTMAYTAAALAFLLYGLPVPVMLTGSMRPAGQADTDAWRNLFGAMLALCKGVLPGVYVYFHGQLLPGTRISKFYSSHDDAFQVLRTGAGVPMQPRQAPSVVPDCLAYQAAMQEVPLAVIPLFPGIRAEGLQALMSTGVRGVVLECYGTGTGPAADAALMQVLRQASSTGVVIVGISQCPAGTMAPEAYAAGSLLMQAGVLSSAGMTREAALAKLMWLLGSGLDAEQLPVWWSTNLCGELQ